MKWKRNGEQHLQRFGCEVVSCIRWSQKYPVPDYVVLDLNLPVIHGFEVIKTIRARAQSFVAASDLRSKFLTERVVAFPSVHSFDVLGDDKNFISISLNYRDGHLATNARLLIRSRYGAEAESRAV